MTAFWFSVVVLLVSFSVYLAVGFLRSVSRETDPVDESMVEDVAEPEEVWVYDPALAAPKLVVRTDAELVAEMHAHTHPVQDDRFVDQVRDDGPAGVYNVVYWSDDRTHRREKQLFADNPNQARQQADDHEAEYCRETGAKLYSFSRIDYPPEQEQQAT